MKRLSQSLTFDNNPRLTGSIPTELGLLTKLYSLSFENNNHTGPIPSELGLLTKIGKLHLGNNSLTGAIPETLAPLYQDLYHFDVHGNGLLSGSASMTGAITMISRF